MSVRSHVVEDVAGCIVVAYGIAGHQFGGGKARECWLASDLTADPESFEHSAGVSAGAEVVAVDGRRVFGVTTGKLHRAGRFRQYDRSCQDDRSTRGTRRAWEQVGGGDMKIELAA